MKPFNKEYVLDKINEYNNLISKGEIGEYKISEINLKNNANGYMYNNKETYDVVSKELTISNKPIMKLDPREIQGSYYVIKYAKGVVGVVGLGLGYIVQELAKKKDVKKVIVYEISKKVVELYRKNFKVNKKIKIIVGDAFKAKKENFDYFIVDTYGYELSEKVVEDYKFFKKLHNIKEYLFWGIEHFLLSCRYEEIVWVYIPEEWMEMSKKCFTAITDSGYLNEYSQLDGELVSKVLAEFKVVLDDEE